MFKLSLIEKGMVYGSNGKDFMAPIECTLMVYSSNEKGMIPWNIIFRSGNLHGKG